MEVSFARKNEIGCRFFDVIRLQIAIAVDNGEPLSRSEIAQSNIVVSENLNLRLENMMTQ
jgi:hypothetical protein